MLQVRHVVVAAVSLLSLVGCADEIRSTNDDAANVTVDTDTVDPRVEIEFRCPDRKSAPKFQQKAHAALAYVLGGPQPAWDPRRQSCRDAKENLDSLKFYIDGGKCTVQVPERPSEVCNLVAAKYVLTCNGLLAPTFDSVKAVAENLDGCFGDGTSAFFFPAQDATQSIEIDPEPARLRQPLGGSTGATAAAVYVNNPIDTAVVKFPGTYYPNSTLVAGTPCSSTDLGADESTLKVIQATGGYRRCL